jgi:hypothetical protein
VEFSITGLFSTHTEGIRSGVIVPGFGIYGGFVFGFTVMMPTRNAHHSPQHG